VVKMVLSKRPT